MPREVAGAAWVCSCKRKPRGSLLFTSIGAAIEGFARHLSTHRHSAPPSRAPSFPPSQNAPKRAVVIARSRRFPLPTDPTLAAVLPVLAREYKAAVDHEIELTRRARVSSAKATQAQREVEIRRRRELRLQAPRWNSILSGERCTCRRCECDRKAQRDQQTCLACAGGAHGRSRGVPREVARTGKPMEAARTPAPSSGRARPRTIARGPRTSKAEPTLAEPSVCACPMGGCPRPAISKGWTCPGCALGQHRHLLN